MNQPGRANTFAWVLRKGDVRMDGRLTQTPPGYLVQIDRNRTLMVSHVLPTKELAEAALTQIREHYEAVGWKA